MSIVNRNNHPKWIELEPELLRSLYWGNQYSIRKIADICKVTDMCIKYKMKIFNIPRRTKSEALSGNHYDKMIGCKGNKHYNWKGGITPKNKKIRFSKEMKIWRETVFKRDNYKCQICYENSRKLRSHHIKSFSEYPKSRFDINNGITLCEECHKWIHRLNPINQQ